MSMDVLCTTHMQFSLTNCCCSFRSVVFPALSILSYLICGIFNIIIWHTASRKDRDEEQPSAFPSSLRAWAAKYKSRHLQAATKLQVTHCRLDYLTGRYYPPPIWRRRTRGCRKAGWPGGTTCCSEGWSKWRLSASAGSCRWPDAPPPARSPQRHLRRRTQKQTPWHSQK